LGLNVVTDFLHTDRMKRRLQNYKKLSIRERYSVIALYPVLWAGNFNSTLILIVRCTKIYNMLILQINFCMDIKEKIGKRLRELRTAKGISQEKFSFECDLDRTYIASIEQGRRNVSIANIEKIAKAFNISVSDFFNSNLFK